jgi:hypothetical protein
MRAGSTACIRKDARGVITHLGVIGLFEKADPKLYTKAALVQQVKRKTNLHPLWRDAQGRYVIGPQVHVVGDPGSEYLTTEPNDTTKDNLGSLGTCTDEIDIA